MNEAAPIAAVVEEAASFPAPLPAPPPEVTLVFSLEPAAVARFWRSESVSPLRDGRIRRVPLAMTWHEMPPGSLAKTGHLVLRSESLGKATLQRLQLARDGVLTWPLGTPPIAQEQPESPEDLPPPLAGFDGSRRTLSLKPDSGLVTVSAIEGTLSVADTTHAVAELSIHGTAPAALSLARALIDEVKLTVSEAGVSGDVRRILLGGAAPKLPVLRPDLPVDDAFAHVVSQLATTILYHAPGARAGEATEPVHQMRVALRRLRSALSLFGRLTGGAELDQARRDLGALARALGPARDWDVFLAGTGRDVGRLLPGDKAVIRLLAAARRRRRAAYADLALVLDGGGFQRLLIDLIELAVARPWRPGLRPDLPSLTAFARHALDRRLRRVTDGGEDLSLLAPDELHSVRIQCKRLRYAAELFAPLAPGKGSRRFLRRLAAVQERLGQLNDGTVAGGLLAELGSRGYAAGVVQGYMAARTGGGRNKAARSWRRFRKADPFWQ